MNEFVTFDAANKLKNLGFDESCSGWWFGDGSSKEPHKEWREKYNEIYVRAPTYQQVTDWFRVKHNIYIKSDPCDFINDPFKTLFVAVWFKNYWFTSADEQIFETYYEALDYAIEQSFKLITT